MIETHPPYNPLNLPTMSYKYSTPYDTNLQIEYAQPHPDFDLVIHPNSTAGQLGFTPEEMAPILQEQQELMATMSYEPKRWYEYPPARHAQPPPKLYIHLNSAAAQLGLTQEETREVLAE